MDNSWYFLTNHAHVLICVDDDPEARLRDIASSVGITERSAHKILSQLVEEGYVLKEKVGRRNSYTVQSRMSMKHPLLHEKRIDELLKISNPLPVD